MTLQHTLYTHQGMTNLVLHLPLWPPAHCNTCSTMKYFLYSVVASTSLAAMPLQQGLSPVVSSCIVCCIYLSGRHALATSANRRGSCKIMGLHLPLWPPAH